MRALVTARLLARLDAIEPDANRVRGSDAPAGTRPAMSYGSWAGGVGDLGMDAGAYVLRRLTLASRSQRRENLWALVTTGAETD